MTETTEMVAQEQSIIENVSDQTLAQVVADGIKYEFQKYVLVKPLAVDMVKKVVTMPVKIEDEFDAEGEPVMEMKESEVEIESIFRRGIVIKSIHAGYNVGDTIVYPNRRSMDFDLIKDSALVEPFDIVAKIPA